jgi:hypothetical protein
MKRVLAQYRLPVECGPECHASHQDPTAPVSSTRQDRHSLRSREDNILRSVASFPLEQHPRYEPFWAQNQGRSLRNRYSRSIVKHALFLIFHVTAIVFTSIGRIRAYAPRMMSTRSATGSGRIRPSFDRLLVRRPLSQLLQSEEQQSLSSSSILSLEDLYSLLRETTTEETTTDCVTVVPREGDSNPKFLVVLYHAHYCKICQRANTKYQQMAKSYPASTIQFARLESSRIPADQLRTGLGVSKFPFIQIFLSFGAKDQNMLCVASFGPGPIHLFQKVLGDTIDTCLRRSLSDWQCFMAEFQTDVQANLRQRQQLLSSLSIQLSRANNRTENFSSDEAQARLGNPATSAAAHQSNSYLESLSQTASSAIQSDSWKKQGTTTRPASETASFISTSFDSTAPKIDIGKLKP